VPPRTAADVAYTLVALRSGVAALPDFTVTSPTAGAPLLASPAASTAAGAASGRCGTVYVRARQLGADGV
jgi:hypothetical protein